MRILGIIPARFGSTRFPGKPLALLGEKPVIQHVYEQVKDSVDAVCVATDDQRIIDCVTAFGGTAVMTSTSHRSGTDRCKEAWQIMERMSSKANSKKPYYDIVVNIQGDEPFIHSTQIKSLLLCFELKDTDIATLIYPFENNVSYEALANPNSPKVVIGKDGRALYFSRSVIPFLRNIDKDKWSMNHQYYKHIGLYGYRTTVLDKITQMDSSSLEVAESLEQLRWLENGYVIRTAVTKIATVGIDTPEDLANAEKILQNRQ
ncbi:MAG: 3-deoxy-manno-octulosonate cytidylyltransferase [Bacteroidaceae bacterium]